MLDRVTPSIVRFAIVLVGAAMLVLAGCGTQVGTPRAAAAQSLRSLESERSQVAGQYWPTTSVVMKAVPGMEARLRIRLRFAEAFGTFASCGPDVGAGLQYKIAVIIEASGHRYEDLGPPLGQAAHIAEQALAAEGWGPFSVSQGVWVAAEHDGVNASFDNDPAATESETSFATALVYFLEGACVPVPSSASTAPGTASLPSVRDSYGLGPATVPPLAQPTVAMSGPPSRDAATLGSR